MVVVVVNSASVTSSLPLPSDDDGVVVDSSWMHFVLLTKEPEGHRMYVSLQMPFLIIKIPSKLEVAPPPKC